MRRLLLIIILTTFVLLTIAAGLAWYLLGNETFLKNQLSELSLKYTGRELQISGPLSLDLGRETTLHASEIHFANAAWAEQPDMVFVGTLQLSVDIPSLFSDTKIFPAVEIDNCSVSLQKERGGAANWNISPEPGSPQEPELQKERPAELPLWVQDIKIHSCELNLDTPQLEQALDIQIADLAVQHHADNRWAAQGAGIVNTAPMTLEGWLAPFGSIFRGGPAQHELNMSIGDLLSFTSSGSVQDLFTWSGANITAQLKGPDIEDILNEFNLPIFSQGAFDYQVRLNTEGSMTKLDLDGDLGTVDIHTTGRLDQLIKPTRGNVEFTGDGPNLGALAQVFGVEGLLEDSFHVEAYAAFEGDEVHLQKVLFQTERDQLQIGGIINTRPGFPGTGLDIHIQSEEAGSWLTVAGLAAQTIGPLTLDGNFSSDSAGQFSLNSTVVNNESKLEVEGVLGHLPATFAPELKISFSSPDPAALANLAGFQNFPAVPLAASGRLGWKDGQLKLDKVDIDLAGDQAKIDGLLSMKDHYAGSDFMIDVDIRNVQELGRLFGRDDLPNQALRLSGEIRPEGKGLAIKIHDGNLGRVQIDLVAEIPDLDHLQRVNSDFDIRLPSFDDISFLFPAAALPDKPFSAKGKIQSDEDHITIENVTVDLSDSRVNIDGFINLANRYAGSRLNFDLKIGSTAEIGRIFGKDGLPDQPLNLTASIEPADQGLIFSVSDGNLGDIQLELEGHIADLAKPAGVDAQFDISLPSLQDIAFLVPGMDFPDLPFTATGRLINEQAKTHLDGVNLQMGKMSASVAGDIMLDNSFQLSVTAAGPNASKLGNLIGTSLPASAFSVSTAVAGNLKKFDLQRLSVELGKSQASGEMLIGLGETFQLHGTIDSPWLDLRHWLPGSPDGEVVEEKTAQNAKKEWLFDNTAIDSMTDKKLDIDLNLTADMVELENTTIEDIALGIKRSKSLLQITPFTFKGTRGGRFSGEFSLDGTDGTPVLHLAIHGDDVRLGLIAAPGQDPATFPPSDIDVTLTGAGATRRELASSLNGKFRSFMGSGEVARAGLDLLFSDFLTQLFTTLNPFAKTSEYTQLDCAVIAAEAVDGNVTIFPLIYHTSQLTILSEGTVDLKTEKIKLSFNTKPRTGLGITPGTVINPLIKVGGSLSAPAVTIDPAGTIASGGLAVVTMGISVLAKSMADRFLSSSDPCGDARKELAKRDSGG